MLSLADYSLNIHPSLLPYYKGCFSIPWCIINDEKYTGFTFHELDNTFDTGRIIYQKKIKIEKYETSYSLYAKVHSLIFQNFISVLQNYVEEIIIPVPQEQSLGTYYPRRLPYDGKINPEWEPNMIDRFIRAMYYPPFDLPES